MEKLIKKSESNDVWRQIKYQQITNTPYAIYTDTIFVCFCGKKYKKTDYGIQEMEVIKEKINELSPIGDFKLHGKTDDKSDYFSLYAIHKDKMESFVTGKEESYDVIEKVEKIKNIDDYEFIFYNFYNGSKLSLDQKPFPVAVYISYINGHLDNGHYDLKSFIKELKDNPAVLNRDSLEIEPIPYYNADEEVNETLKIVFLPTADEYKKYMGLDYWNRYTFYIDECLNGKKYKIEE